MEPMQSTRRDFLSNTVKTGAAMSVLFTATGSLLSSCGILKGSNSSKTLRTGFNQEQLPYSFNALEEAIDGTTMEIHYSRHAAGYATNLQDAARNEGVDTSKPLEEVLEKISKFSSKMRNNAGGHYNHELFWKSMSPRNDDRPSGKLLTSLEESFGSFDTFKTQFSDAGKNQFGSGWAWLIVDRDKKLRVGSTPNQDNPLMDVSSLKGFPLLGLDVWEHAYYLRYQNKRADYITNWWKVVNWDYIQQRYDDFL